MRLSQPLLRSESHRLFGVTQTDSEAVKATGQS